MRVIFSSLILAFCGLAYELVLAQTMSVLLGNSFLQYGLTIGLFMAGMGVGALRAEDGSEPRRTLMFLQSVLCVTAPAGFLILWSASLILPAFLVWALSCILIFAIGFLTGKELPLLMNLAGSKKEFPVLAADYFGMLAATILFPYLLLPRFGMFGTLCLAAILNALSIQLLIAPGFFRRRLNYAVFPAALIILFAFEESIWRWFSQLYTSGLA